MVEEISKRNDDLEDAVSFLLQERERGDYVELAENYEAAAGDDDPVARCTARPRCSTDDLDALDRILSGASEVNKAYFEEVGYGGGYVRATSSTRVYSSPRAPCPRNQLGLTREQAVTALF